MKSSIFASLSVAAVLAWSAGALPLTAAETPAPSHSPDEIREMSAVEQFLDLSDAELDQLLEVIARIRAMTPAQRAELRAEVARYRQLPSAEREQLRLGWGRMHGGMGAGWGQMPTEIQEGWREMMHNATPEQRAGIQAKLQSLAPAERNAWRRQLVEDYLKAKAAAK